MKLHDCQKTQQQMTDWLFAASAPTVPAELVDCQSCLNQYLSLKDALHRFDQASAALLPDEAYWPGYEAKLRVKLAQEARPSRWQQWMQRPLWLIPALAALLVLLLGIGWSQRLAPTRQEMAAEEIVRATMKSGQDKSSETPKETPRGKRKLEKPERKEPSRPPYKKPYLLDPNPMMASAEQSPSWAENSPTNQHFERAQRLLRSFRNARPGSKDSFDLAYEKKQSRRLLFENILLRREAETRGDWPTEELLSNLEPLLLDIGNLPARPTADDVNPIKERMQKKEIVARLQLSVTPMAVALVE
jgi:hypothetical protein